MKLWLDAHLPPRLARWLSAEFGVECVPIRDLGLRDAKDAAIFAAARSAGAVVVTKDRDFPQMVARLGSPPQVLWLTCGNTSEARLREIFQAHFAEAMRLLDSGAPIVEITDRV